MFETFKEAMGLGEGVHKVSIFFVKERTTKSGGIQLGVGYSNNDGSIFSNHMLVGGSEQAVIVGLRQIRSICNAAGEPEAFQTLLNCGGIEQLNPVIHSISNALCGSEIEIEVVEKEGGLQVVSWKP